MPQQKLADYNSQLWHLQLFVFVPAGNHRNFSFVELSCHAEQMHRFVMLFVQNSIDRHPVLLWQGCLKISSVYLIAWRWIQNRLLLLIAILCLQPNLPVHFECIVFPFPFQFYVLIDTLLKTRRTQQGTTLKTPRNNESIFFVEYGCGYELPLNII